MTTSNNDDDYVFKCSEDDELPQLGICFNNNWIPFPEEIEELYEQARINKYIPLLWQSPGHKDPNQQKKPVLTETEKPISSTVQKTAESNDFDFEEEASPSLLKLPNKTGSGFKSSPTKKRTTTLAGILSDMERHRIIEKRDESAGVDKEANPKKSTTGN